MSLGKTSPFEISIDAVSAQIFAHVVPDSFQDTPALIGRDFTEQSHIWHIKTPDRLQFFQYSPDAELTALDEPPTVKIRLVSVNSTCLLPFHLTNISVVAEGYFGDLFLEASVRLYNDSEVIIPRTIITLGHNSQAVVPLLNFSSQEIQLRKGQVVARGYPCVEEDLSAAQLPVLRTSVQQLSKISLNDIEVGPVDNRYKDQLIRILNEYRDCIALSTRELRCVKSAEMEIHLTEDKPFYYRPYTGCPA